MWIQQYNNWLTQAQATSSLCPNSIVLGNASISSLQCNVQSISALSDERDKTDIQDLTLGLDFNVPMRPTIPFESKRWYTRY